MARVAKIGGGTVVGVQIQPTQPWPHFEAAFDGGGGVDVDQSPQEDVVESEVVETPSAEELTAQAEAERQARCDEVQKKSVDDLERHLKKKIAGIMRYNKALETAKASQSEVEATLEKLNAQIESLRLPITTNKKLLQDYSEELERLMGLRLEATYGLEDAQAAVALAGQQLACFLSLLQESVEVAGKREDLANNETLAAASYLASLYAPQKTFVMPTPETEEDRSKGLEWNGEQKKILSDVREAVLAAATQLAALYADEQELTEISVRNGRLRRTIDIVQPTRPSEEEVQRYLGQLFDYMVRRQTSDQLVIGAHNTLASTLAKSTALKLQSEKLVDQLMDAGYYATGILKRGRASYEPEFLAAGNALQRMIDKLSQLEFIANEALTGVDLRPLDGANEVNVTDTERRDIDNAKGHMRIMAFAMGRRNEARVNLRAAEATTVPPVTLEGLAATKAVTWNDFMDWRKNKAQDMFVAGRAEISRTTKIELMKESYEAAESEVDDKIANLARHVATCMAVGYDRPCNELRAIYNAAGWACRPDQEGKKTPLKFPLFPTKE